MRHFCKTGNDFLLLDASSLNEGFKELQVQIQERDEHIFNLELTVSTLQKQNHDAEIKHSAAITDAKAKFDAFVHELKLESEKERRALHHQVISLSDELETRFDEEEKIRVLYEEKQLHAKALSREITELEQQVDCLKLQLNSRGLVAKKERFSSFGSLWDHSRGVQLSTDRIAFGVSPKISGKERCENNAYLEKPFDSWLDREHQEKLAEKMETSQNEMPNNSKTNQRDGSLLLKAKIDTIAITEAPQSLQSDFDTIAITEAPQSLQSDFDTIAITEAPQSLQSGVDTIAITEAPQSLQSDVPMSEEDIRRLGMIERKREERIIRTAEQRRERDERERRERLANRRPAAGSATARNVVTNRAQPVRKQYQDKE
jgi:hypothetical protein